MRRRWPWLLAALLLLALAAWLLWPRSADPLSEPLSEAEHILERLRKRSKQPNNGVCG